MLVTAQKKKSAPVNKSRGKKKKRMSSTDGIAEGAVRAAVEHRYTLMKMIAEQVVIEEP